jgi:phage gp36-like protein
MGFVVNTGEVDYGTPPVYGSIQALIDRFGERELIQISDRTGQAAIKFLTLVSTGKVGLGLDTNTTPVPSAGGPAMETSERVFSQERLADY